MNFWSIFKRDKKTTPAGKQIVTRSFKSALPSRFTNWLYSSFEKINADTNAFQVTLVSRARELAKNNTVVRSWLENIEKNVIGEQGFVLQSQVKAGDELDAEFNDAVEWKWYDYIDPLNGWLTTDGRLGRSRA